MRPEAELRGLDSETMRWNKIRNNESNSMLLDTEVSEKVLMEDWPAKMRVCHLERIELISS